MKVAIRIDDELHAKAKQMASRRGITLKALIEHALRMTLARAKRRRKVKRVRLITDGHEGLRPGVNLDDSADLLDFLDEAPG